MCFSSYCCFCRYGSFGSVKNALYLRIRKPESETYLEAAWIWTNHFSEPHFWASYSVFNCKMGVMPPFSHNFKTLLWERMKIFYKLLSTMQSRQILYCLHHQGSPFKMTFKNNRSAIFGFWIFKHIWCIYCPYWWSVASLSPFVRVVFNVPCFLMGQSSRLLGIFCQKAPESRGYFYLFPFLRVVLFWTPIISVSEYVFCHNFFSRVCC